MARTLEQERAAIEKDVRKLEERRQRLEEKEREAAIQAIEKTGLLKLETKRLGNLLGPIRSLRIDAVETRMTACTAPAARRIQARAWRGRQPPRPLRPTSNQRQTARSNPTP